MKKCKKIVSILSCMAMAVNLLPGISAMADNETSTLLASDKTTNWAMQWSWERYEAGWDYYADWTLTNGFEITYNKAKYDALISSLNKDLHIVVANRKELCPDPETVAAEESLAANVQEMMSEDED